MNGEEITMCTSYHSPETRTEFELNYDLTRRMNPDVRIAWLVGDAMVPRVRDTVSRENVSVFSAPTKDDVPRVIGWRSIQHAGALNLLLPYVKTRFLAVLHPDFYVIRRGWMGDVITQMDGRGLGFFGSPVHPLYFDKWRYFPCTQFMVVDLDKIPIGDLDFLPGDMKAWEKSYTLPAGRSPANLLRLLYARLIERRSLIGTSRDSGWRLFQKFAGKEDAGCECVRPFFRPWRDRDRIDTMLWIPNALIEFFLPERRCFVPKQRESYSVRGFRDHGYPDAARYGCEEYLWRGKPFAIHQRGTRAGYSRGDGAGDVFAVHIDRIRALLRNC